MIKKFISPFKPKNYLNFKPQHFKIYTFKAGFKKHNKDLLVIVFNKLVTVSAVYTKSSTPSAPVLWGKKRKKNLCKVLIINSGNANAFTGILGLKAIRNYAKVASNLCNCKINEVFISSTGIIGEQLNSDLIIKKLKLLKNTSSGRILEAAQAIMTTDTYPKIAKEIVRNNKDQVKIFGIAKGSGMIAPKMGTMLAYIFIEAPLSKIELSKILNENIETTFNSISIDGDTSTNDTVMLFSLGNNKSLKKNSQLKKSISLGVKNVMRNLSKQIVCDGEGISKLIEVNVINAQTKIQATRIAFSIAESLLIKTAVYGEDANWGRIIMAIGKVGENINQSKIILKIGEFIVAENGMMSKKIKLKKLSKYMKNKIIRINLNLKLGKNNKTVWSSDLTNEYININADYRS